MAQDQPQEFVLQSETGEAIDPASLGLDQEQIAALLAQGQAEEGASSGTTTIQYVDEEGNPIELTPEQLAAAGITLDGSSGAQIIQLQDTETDESGQMVYVIQQDGDESAAALKIAGVEDAEALNQLESQPDQDSDALHSKSDEAEARRYRTRRTATAQGRSRMPEIDPVPAPTQLSFACEQCPKRFASEPQLRRHVDVTHAPRKEYYCAHCEKNLLFSSVTHFHAHIRMQHKVNPGDPPKPKEQAPTVEPGADDPIYQCGACGANFATTDVLIDHINQDHADLSAREPEPAQQQAEPPAPPSPKRRRMGGMPPSSLQQNAAAPAPGYATRDVHKCRVCGKEYLSLSGFKKHMAEHPGLDVLMQSPPKVAPRSSGVQQQPRGLGHECAQCGQRFSTPEGLQVHTRVAHSSGGGRGQQKEEILMPYHCNMCNRRFPTNDHLMKHYSEMHREGRQKCPECGKEFANSRRLESHLQAHAQEIVQTAQPPSRDQICPICHRGFIERESLAKHLREHNNEAVFPCNECEKKFTEAALLEKHMQTHTGVLSHACHFCGKSFSRAESLKAHSYLHTADKPYRCAQCGGGFRSRWLLKSHEKLHKNTKAHACDQCGRSFNQLANLKVHQKGVHSASTTATTGGPFQCSACHRSFHRIEHLQSHVNAHKGIRPYPCRQCDAAFYSPEHLSQHERVHNGEKPFECGVCGKVFTKRAVLQKHVQGQHTKAMPSAQYVVLWEKAGALQEALIMSDSHEAPAMPQQTGPTTSYTALSSQEKPAQQPTTSNVAGMASELLGSQHVQLVDEHGNPVAGNLSEQFLILDDGSGVAGQQVVDRNTLMALASGALQQSEDGNIYITQEELEQFASQPGVVLQYQQ